MRVTQVASQVSPGVPLLAPWSHCSPSLAMPSPQQVHAPDAPRARHEVQAVPWRSVPSQVSLDWFTVLSPQIAGQLNVALSQAVVVKRASFSGVQKHLAVAVSGSLAAKLPEHARVTSGNVCSAPPRGSFAESGLAMMAVFDF